MKFREMESPYRSNNRHLQTVQIWFVRFLTYFNTALYPLSARPISSKEKDIIIIKQRLIVIQNRGKRSKKKIRTGLVKFKIIKKRKI